MCVSTGHLIQQIQTLACILYLTVVGKSFEYFMSKSALFLYLPSTLNNCMTKGILLNHFKVAWKSNTLPSVNRYRVKVPLRKAGKKYWAAPRCEGMYRLCMNVKQGSPEKEHAHSAKPFPG